MKSISINLLALLFIISFQHCSSRQEQADAVSQTDAVAAEAYYSTTDFDKVKKIDVHIHIRKDDSSLIEQAAADNFHLLNINVNSPASPPVAAQQALAIRHVQAFPQQVAFAAAFSVEDFNEPGWTQQTIAYLKDAFAKGAVGVKTWKNIGMDLKDKSGKFVMIDHPRFDPVLDFIASNNITLLSHQGEPKNCWLPVEEMTVAGDKNYFTENPQYHMYLHPEYPSYEDQINARDRMLEKHPDLKVVSVHLASLEWSVDELARRLDKYPNLSVDMAARIAHLQHQAAADWQKVHDFFIKYQDRILYGTDIVIRPNDERAPADVKQSAHQTWLADWKFLATDEMLTNSSNTTFKGLKLPRQVVDKVYFSNAQKWIPGIVKIESKL